MCAECSGPGSSTKRHNVVSLSVNRDDQVVVIMFLLLQQPPQQLMALCRVSASLVVSNSKNGEPNGFCAARGETLREVKNNIKFTFIPPH